MEAKKGKFEVEGYLHEVSDLIGSNEQKKYFTALLQEAGKNSRVIVFDPHRHSTFKAAEKDKTPVKLCDIILSASRQIKGDMDIVVNYLSTSRCVRKLDFAFDNTLQQKTEQWTLRDILDDPREYQRVKVTVKVINLTESCNGMTRTQHKMMKRVYNVADTTDSISLCVWGGQPLNIGNWYEITNASIRKIHQTTCLSTTAETSLTIIPERHCTVAKVVDKSQLIEGEITTAEVNLKYICPKQHILTEVNFSTQTTRCQQCDAFCKTAAITKLLRANISIRQSSGKSTDIMIDDFVLCGLLELPDKRSTMDCNSLAEKLLSHDGMAVKLLGNRVTDAKFLDASECKAPQESAPNPQTTCNETLDNDDLSELDNLHQLFDAASDAEMKNDTDAPKEPTRVDTKTAKELIPKSVAQCVDLSKIEKPKEKTGKKKFHDKK